MPFSIDDYSIAQPVKFEFEGRDYYALIRIKQKEPATEYYVTIMNGDLEKLLFGNHLFIPENDTFRSDLAPDTQLGRLKTVMAETLTQYIRSMQGQELNAC